MTTERVLVDTSAWIAGFRKAGHPELKEFLKYCISSGFAATCPVVILELLQGCKTETERTIFEPDWRVSTYSPSPHPHGNACMRSDSHLDERD